MPLVLARDHAFQAAPGVLGRVDRDDTDDLGVVQEDVETGPGACVVVERLDEVESAEGEAQESFEIGAVEPSSAASGSTGRHRVTDVWTHISTMKRIGSASAANPIRGVM